MAGHNSAQKFVVSFRHVGIAKAPPKMLEVSAQVAFQQKKCRLRCIEAHKVKALAEHEKPVGRTGERPGADLRAMRDLVISLDPSDTRLTTPILTIGTPMTAEHVLQLHIDGTERYSSRSAPRWNSEHYMLVRPDDSVLNKDQVLRDLREQGLKFHTTDFENTVVRFFGSTAILTAESKTVSSRNGKRAHAHVRLVAVYAQESDGIRLVHFQSTVLPPGISATPNEAP